MTPDTTAVDATPGDPTSGWAALQPLDVTDLSLINAPVGPEPSKPTVTGGCITFTPGGPNPTTVPSHWHVVIRGVSKLPPSTMEISFKTRAGTLKISGVTLNQGVADFSTVFQPTTYTLTSVMLVPAKGKGVDVTKSFEAVFGKTMKVTPTDASSLGPDC
jgi:hypothetical protein